MDALQLTIMAATAVALGGVAWAFLKSESFALRMATLGAFGVYYVAMVLWAPTDATWANVTLMVVAVIALMSSRRKPSGHDKPSEPDAEQGGPSDD